MDVKYEHLWAKPTCDLAMQDKPVTTYDNEKIDFNEESIDWTCDL